jgi:hypothetical protein
MTLARWLPLSPTFFEEDLSPTFEVALWTKIILYSQTHEDDVLQL